MLETRKIKPHLNKSTKKYEFRDKQKKDEQKEKSEEKQALPYEIAEIIFKKGFTKMEIFESIPKKLWKKNKFYHWYVQSSAISNDSLNAQQFCKICEMALEIPFRSLRTMNPNSLIFPSMPDVNFLSLRDLSLQQCQNQSIIEKIQRLNLPILSSLRIYRNNCLTLFPFRKVYLPELSSLSINEPQCLDIQALNQFNFNFNKLKRLYLEKKKNMDYSQNHINSKLRRYQQYGWVEQKLTQRIKIVDVLNWHYEPWYPD